VTVDLSSSTGTASDGLGGTDTLLNINGVVGSDFNDSIMGSAGNDLIEGRKGADTINGGGGTDTASYHGDYDANGDGQASPSIWPRVRQSTAGASPTP